MKYYFVASVTLAWLLLLSHRHVVGFTPAIGPRTRILTHNPDVIVAVGRLSSTKKKDWISELQDWFETVTHPEAKKTDETPKVDDTWIAKELNELGATGLSELDVVEEVMVAKEEPPEEKPVVMVQEIVTAQEVEQALEHEEVPAPKAKAPQPKPKVQKTTYEWLTKDMLKAGKGERESKDWVAEDMKKSGKIGLTGDWVAEDMKEAGQAGEDHTPTVRKSTKKVKTETDRIAEGMTQVGRNSGLGWIAQDMAEAGKAREARTMTGTEKLRDQLDTQHEKDYDDVFKGMEKVGKQGTGTQEWVEDDMTRAGKAESMMDKLNAATKDVTYKFEKWQKKRFETDKIREHMESAGHAESRDWVAHDIESTGRNKTQVGRKYPAPKKELREWLAQDESSSIASDLEAEGRASGDRRSRKEKLSRDKLADLVAADMEMVGKTSGEWVETDMERTGRAEPHLNKESATMSHMQRETKVFMDSRKPKIAPTPEVAKVVETAEAPEENLVKEAESIPQLASPAPALVDAAPMMKAPQAEHHPHHDFKHNIMRASKKVIMPWKKWEDL